MGSFIDNFKALNSLLLKELEFFKTDPVEVVDFSPPAFRETCRTKIQAGKQRLAKPYQNGYIEPLLKNFEGIHDALKPIPGQPRDRDPHKYAYLTSLVNAALQPDQELVAPYLVAIQGIVDDLHQSFLTSRTNLGIPPSLDQAISPLVGFVGPLPSRISKKAPMPATFELEQMRDREHLPDHASDFKAGTIVIPAGYLKAPLLWSVLGHEVGGHYALTADRGDKLLSELRSKIYDMVLDQFPNKKAMAAIWMHWAEETAADVCGVLSLGPSYGKGMIHYYTAQLPSAGWSDKTSSRSLETVSSTLDNHPTPVLVPYVISGAVKALSGLSASRKFRYTAQIEEIARVITREEEVLTFPNSQTLMDKDKVLINLPKEQSLELMRESALLVGSYIASVPLNALNGHTLQELATWNDGDEDAAIEVANQLMKPESSSAIATSRNKPKRVQLLSGGILAVIRAPELYGHVNRVLLKEFGV